MAFSNNNIKISLVRDTIGENTNDLGSLNRSNKINPYSLWKPINSNKLTLTEDDFYSTNDGFQTSSYNSAYDCWNAIVNGETWLYEARHEPYRLGDWRNYDHYANNWFIWDFMNTSNAKKGESRPIVNSGSKDLQWLYNNFSLYSFLQNTTQDNACLGLLMSNRWTGNDDSVYFYRICSVLDYDSERLNFTVPSDLNVYDTTYKFTPVISSYMLSQNGSCTYFSRNNPPQVSSFWYPTPSNIFSLYLSHDTYVPPKPFSVIVDMGPINFDYYSYNYTIENLEGDIIISLSQSVSYPVTFGTTIYYNNSPSQVTVANVGGTFAAGETTKTLHFGHRDPITVVASLKDEDELLFEVYTTYSYLGYNYHQTDYVTGYKQ